MKKQATGFTLVELLICVAILALLASVAVPLSELSVKRGKEQDLRRALREVRGAIDGYKKASDEGRIERAADKSGYPPNLAVLVEGVTDQKDPKGAKVYFLRRLPVDPITGDAWGLRSYASPHNEPQVGADVFDIHTKSAESGINGVPYREW
jgi:general secretion pathway protein G